MSWYWIGLGICALLVVVMFCIDTWYNDFKDDKK